MGSPDRVVKYVETMFKLRGTNYSQVASKLKGRNGKPMSRQALFRMVKNGTISLQTVMDIADVLNMTFEEIFPGIMNDVQGDRVRSKINGKVYDTDKMFSYCEYMEDGKLKEEDCWNPLTGEIVTVHYFGDESRKYPYMEIKHRKKK